MKKTLVSLLFLVVFIASSAQITVDSDVPYKNYTDYEVDYLIMFAELKSGANAEINYSISGNSFVWYKFQNGTKTFYSSSTSDASLNLDLETSIGYLLNVDGEDVLTIWVIDYSVFSPTFKSITWADNSGLQCENLPLTIEAEIPEMKYEKPSGEVYYLTRKFDLSYKNLSFEENVWTVVGQKESIALPQFVVEIETPLTNTSFLLEGDQFAKDLGLMQTYESEIYFTNAVSAMPTTILSTRDAKNENERPDDLTKRSGSAPLEIYFKSNATPNVVYYNWLINKDGLQIFTRNDSEFSYTFSEYGKYEIKLTVSNEFCAYTDSTILIDVKESELLVPRVFTPNGDGLNDEFRVAYKSIIEFEGWVYNRWGRLVFHWKNPAEGWDGKINGKNAAEGAYFYVIKARGADGEEYLKKGDINLIRGGKK